MTHCRPTIAAVLGLALLIQAPGLAAQDAAPPPPPAAKIGPATGGLVANTTTLEINFVQIANPTGQIMLALFDSKEAYDSGAAPVTAIVVPVTGDTATAAIPNVLHGRYGFKIVHDVNGDGAMNTNPFGMPIEPFAFSNNAVGNMGPATWEAAAFDIAGPAVQTIAFR
ncbi:DUF2141 domain-containing protein [Porphyrobacter sp. SLTP]|uniref:DUF2141 domain-containing protein n=1 Tax=Porphyrobacter sp. SLTP TaxID=2683266 RepID=UPI0014123665|nr:DUF2141 domain-containing protein [Porphyrobacter sp. SLTP]NBB23545.1 DUF2141 domain-containing protein [Porphyrobacter sp. SLTP]